ISGSTLFGFCHLEVQWRGVSEHCAFLDFSQLPPPPARSRICLCMQARIAQLSELRLPSLALWQAQYDLHFSAAVRSVFGAAMTMKLIACRRFHCPACCAIRALLSFWSYGWALI